MKKCLGCGAILQTEDPKAKGYVKSIEQDYCMRCFRLSHYGDLILDMKEAIKADLVLEEIAKTKELIVFVVDVLSLEVALNQMVIDTFKGRDVILLINKYDLLPKNINTDKYLAYVEELVESKMKGIRVKDIILTHHKDPYFNELFFESLNNLNINSVLFCGNVNAGKSTIINKLCNHKSLTTSVYPSTTLAFNELHYDGYTFIDTPGFVFDGNALLYIDDRYLKDVLFSNTIKPKVFQLYEDQAYLVEGLLRVDIKTNKKASVIFYLNNRLDIHRTKLINADNYEEKHKSEMRFYPDEIQRQVFKSDEAFEVVIDGVGLISFKNIEEVSIKCDKRIKLLKRKSVI